MRKTISVINKRVLDAMEGSNNASRLIEEAVLYYLDSLENEYVTKDIVKGIVLDCLKDVVLPITNKNYAEPILEDINAILEMGD